MSSFWAVGTRFPSVRSRSPDECFSLSDRHLLILHYQRNAAKLQQLYSGFPLERRYSRVPGRKLTSRKKASLGHGTHAMQNTPERSLFGVHAEPDHLPRLPAGEGKDGSRTAFWIAMPMSSRAQHIHRTVSAALCASRINWCELRFQGGSLGSRRALA